MHRLFVAIRPPEPVRENLLDTMEGLEGARWQEEEKLHLTLRFVGEVSTAVANELAEALARVAVPPFSLRVAGVGHFERKGRPHAIWARIAADPGLEALRQKVERACASAGLEREARRFTPHITLARLNRSGGDPGPWLARWGDLSAGPWAVDGFGLWESHLGTGGSHYDEAVRYSLATDERETPFSAA